MPIYNSLTEPIYKVLEPETDEPEYKVLEPVIDEPEYNELEYADDGGQNIKRQKIKLKMMHLNTTFLNLSTNI